MRDIDAVSLEGNIENSFIRQGVEEMRENPGISEAHAFVRQSISSMENRKVFFINTVIGPGNSVGRLTEGLYRMLTEHGYECMAAFGRGDAPSDQIKG